MIRPILSWVLWPLLVVANIFFLVMLTRSVEPQQLLIIAGPLFVTQWFILLVLERLLPYRNEWSVRGDPNVWRDIGHTIVFGVVGQRLGGVLTVLVAALFVDGTAFEVLNTPRGIWPGTSPLLVQILLIIVVGDFLEYWLHRLTHTPKFWRLHALHHTPERLHVFKTGRHHLIYIICRSLFVWMPILALGAPLLLLIWHPLSIGVFGTLGHANINFRVPGLVHRLLMTPHFHRIHHSVDMKLGNSNFSVIFPIWDMLFGTFIDPRTVEVGKLGIKDDPIPHKFLQELLSPFRWGKLVNDQRARHRPEEHARVPDEQRKGFTIT